MGLIVFQRIFLNIPRIQIECGRIYENMSVPHNIAMDLNNVMVVLCGAFKFRCHDMIMRYFSLI